jgi:hypothetical protein
MSIRDRIYDLRRRLFGRYTIDDPRPIAASAPYTYYLPSENELLALLPNDLVKIIFRSHPPGRAWDAERMWVIVTATDGEILEGRLDNHPSDLPQLKAGDVVRFKRSDVIDIDWDSHRDIAPPKTPPRRWYWERCFVDRCVLDDGVKVYYLYREEPDPTEEGETYPDSGWRLRGDDRGVTDEELSERKIAYVALGAVLNWDDSWLHLIDEPVGAAFLRNWETDAFEPEERAVDGGTEQE